MRCFFFFAFVISVWREGVFTLSVYWLLQCVCMTDRQEEGGNKWRSRATPKETNNNWNWHDVIIRDFHCLLLSHSILGNTHRINVPAGVAVVVLLRCRCGTQFHNRYTHTWVLTPSASGSLIWNWVLQVKRGLTGNSLGNEVMQKLDNNCATAVCVDVSHSLL